MLSGMDRHEFDGLRPTSGNSQRAHFGELDYYFYVIRRSVEGLLEILRALAAR